MRGYFYFFGNDKVTMNTMFRQYFLVLLTLHVDNENML